MAILAAVVLMGVAVLSTAQTSPVNVTAVAGDGAITVSWTLPIADNAIQSFQVQAVPQTPPTPFYLDSSNTTVYDLDGNVLDTTIFDFRVGNCVNAPLTPARLCNSVASPVTVANTFVQSNGRIEVNLRFLHGLLSTTGTAGTTNGYLQNGLPMVTLRGATAAEDVVWTALVDHGKPYTPTLTSGNTHSGLMVYDFDPQGVLRPVIQMYYLHNSLDSSTNSITLRFLTSGGTYSTLTVTSGTTNVRSQPMEIGIYRNARERYWRYFWRSASANGGRWNFFSTFHQDGQLIGNLQSNATVALFASNDHTTLNRTMTFERITVSRGTAVEFFLRNLTAFEALTPTTGSCNIESTVTRTGLLYSTARRQYSYTIRGLLNAVPYQIRLSSVGTSGPATPVVLPGLVTPAVTFPTLANSPGSSPALFLDATSTAPGKVFLWRDLSGNNRHVSQYWGTYQPTSQGISTGYPVGALTFPFARNEMVQVDKDDQGLDAFPGGMSLFTVYKNGYTNVYIYSFGLVSRVQYLYNALTNVVANQYENARPISDEPGWDVYAIHNGYNLLTTGAAPACAGMRVVASRNTGSTPTGVAGTPSAPSVNTVGIRYSLAANPDTTFSTNPELLAPVMYTYNYYQAPAALTTGSTTIPQGTWLVDGCKGIQLGLTSDRCMYPNLDQVPANSVAQQFTAGTYPYFEPGFGSDVSSTYFPAPLIRPSRNVDPFALASTGLPSTVTTHQASRAIFKVSDAGSYGVSFYSTKYFYGDLYGVLIYKNAIVNRADRETVQKWFGQRYGQVCSTIAYPWTQVTGAGGLSSPCAAGPASATTIDGRAVSTGTTCTTTCTPGKVRLGGIPTGEAYTCNNGVMANKGMWCGSQCSVLTMPANANGCALHYVDERFDQAAGSALRWMIQYDVVPPRALAAAEAMWSFTGSALRGELPYLSETCGNVAPTESLFATNRPAWGDLTVSPGRVVSSIDITLDQAGARAGLGFRVSMVAGGTTNYYRVWFGAGEAGATLEYVSRTATSITTRAFGTSLQPTWTPVAGVTYTVSVTTNQGFISVSINNVLHFDAAADAAIPHGGIGALIVAGSASFDNMRMSGACASNGNCQASEGSSCTYTCAPGFVAVGDATRGCGSQTTTPLGNSLRCVPPAPVPTRTGIAFNVFEDSPVGTILGTVNVTVTANGTLDRVVLFSFVSGNNETMRDILGNPITPPQEYTEVFDVGFCTGVISLQAGGALNAARRSTYNLVLRAALAVDDTVFTDIPVTVTVANARNRPVFLDQSVSPPAVVRSAVRNIDENAAVGTTLGNPVSAVSVEPGQVVQYAIVSGNSMGFFAINNATGQLRVARLGLDFESVFKAGNQPRQFDLFIQANDRDFPSLLSVIQVTINIQDVNDAPVVPLQQMDIIEDRVASTTMLDERGNSIPNLIGTISGASDDDQGDALTYRLDLASNGDTRAPVTNFFLNTTTGEITLVQPIVLSMPINKRPVNQTDGRLRRAYYVLNVTAIDRPKQLATGGTVASRETRFNVRIYVTVNTTYTDALSRAMIVSAAATDPSATTTRTALETFGNDILIITGEGFQAIVTDQGGNSAVTVYLSASAGVGSTPRRHMATGCQILPASDTTITCRTGAGYGSNLALTVEFAGGVLPYKSGLPIFLSYAVPQVTAIGVDLTRAGSFAPTGANLRAQLNNFDTEGTQSISLSVRNTGPLAAQDPVFVDFMTPDFLTVLYRSPQTTLVTASNNGGVGTVRAWLAPFIGANLFIRVTVGNQASVYDAAQFISYGVPLINFIQVSNGTSTLTTFNTIQSGATQQRFEIQGRNFGRSTDAFTVLLSFSASIPITGVNQLFTVQRSVVCRKPTVVDAHRRIECDMPSGFGTGYTTSVVTGDQSSAAYSAQLLGYRAPNVTAISGQGARNADTAGGQDVILAGSNMGPVSVSNVGVVPAVPVFTPYSVTYGPTGTEFVAQNCRAVQFNQGNAISCQTAPGFGTGHVWRVVVAGQVPAAQPTFTSGYGVPVVTSLSKSGTVLNSASDTFVTPGNEVVFIDGTNFGPAAGAIPGPPAALVSVTYRLKLEDTVSSLNTPLTTAPDGTIQYTASNCQITIPHTQMSCLTAQGAGKELAWTVTVAGQSSTQPLLGYRAPRITNVTVLATAQRATAISTDGGETIVISGSDFGPANNCRTNATRGAQWPDVGATRCLGLIQSLYYGPTGTEFLADNVHIVNSNTIWWRSEPGYGRNLRFTIRVAEQESLNVGFGASFSYAAPIVNSVAPGAGNTNTPDNSYVVTVTGRNFGLQDNTADQSIIFGNARDFTELRSKLPTYDAQILPNGDHQVSFYLPRGLLPDRAVRVVVHPRGQPDSVLGVSSDPFASAPGVSYFDYNTPQIDAVVVAATPQDSDTLDWVWQNFRDTGIQLSDVQNAYMLFILGSNFGPAAAVNSDRVERSVVYSDCLTVNSGAQPEDACAQDHRVAGLEGKVREWSDNRIVMFTFEREGRVMVQQSGLSYVRAIGNPIASPVTVTSNIKLYTQLSPTVGNVVGPTQLRTVGGELVTIQAKYLDATQDGLTVLMEAYTSPDGTVNTVPATIVDPVTRQPYANWPAMKAALIDSVRTAQTGAGSNNPNDWTYSISFLTPAGEGTGRAIILQRDGDKSDTSTRVNYASPAISRYSVLNAYTGVWTTAAVFAGTTNIIVPTLGSTIRFWGDNFGLCPRVSMGTQAGKWYIGAGGAAACTSGVATDEPSNHTYLVVKTAPGQGSGHDMNPNGYSLWLTAGNQDTPLYRFRYRTPVITRVTPEGRTAGGDIIQVNGTDFGASAATMSITIGGQPCTDVQYTPVTPALARDQTVTCTLAEGSGGPYSVVYTSVPYTCSGNVAGALCSATVAAAFTYSNPVVSAMWLGGAGDISQVLGSEALAYADFLAENQTSVVDAPAWLHTVPTRNTPGKALYADALAAVGSQGVDMLAAGLPVRLPAAGGHLLTIVGDNFGKLDFARHCLFFAWGGRDRASQFACDNANSFVGEEEVPSLAVLHWSHTLILIVAPPGTGGRELLPWVNGRTLPWALPVHYNTPAVTAQLQPATGNTEGGELITVRGVDFGLAPMSVDPARQSAVLQFFPTSVDLYLTAPRPPMAAMKVNFFRQCVSNFKNARGETSDIPSIRQCGTNPARDFVHTDTSVRFLSTRGIGVNRTVNVEIWDRNSSTLAPQLYYNYTSNPVMFSYKAPFIYATQPFPITMDTRPGYQVSMQGTNLGNPPSDAEIAVNPSLQWSEEELRVQVNVAGSACEGATRLVTPVSGTSMTLVELQCELPPMTVGYKNISYTVAGQSNFNDIDDNGGFPTDSVFMACRAEFFGKPGEFCAPCPEGAVCRGFDSRPVVVGPDNSTAEFKQGGKHSYPRPKSGFFNLNSTDLIVERLKRDGRMAAMDSQYEIACPSAVRSKYPGRDVCIVGCEPAEACLPDNYCAEGYRSLPPQFRCAFCDIGFYKRNNECVKCPNSPWALVIGFCALVLFGAGAAYILNKKKINIAFIAIFVDWAQVIAIFSASRVAWPPIVKELFHILSAFNLNIEIVAPECIVPDLQFRQKWSFIMALPLSLTVFFMLITLGQVAYRSLIKGKKVSFANQGSSFASMTLLLMYVLYIYLTRNILDIFNCQPREPDEGKMYLTVGSGEECYVPGGTQATLYGPAIVAAIVYIAGYPAGVAMLLFKNRDLAIEDQLLRAKGQGDDKLSNPRAYVLRKRFSRVYYQFKPESVFWVLAILLRKFCLAATYILFNRNASFQLASALLVIFVAYAAQMKYQPYMGPGDFEAVIKGFETRALHGDAKAADMWTKIKAVESRGRKKVHKNLMSFNGKVDARALLGLLRGWLFAYNTVEEILLFSAGTVALMGIMYASLNSTSSNFQDARDSVTWVIVGAIILTILYFFTVTLTEVYILYTEDIRRKQMEAKSKVRGGKRGKSLDEDDMKAKDREAAAAMATATGELNVGMVSSNFNPMFEGSSSTSGLREVVSVTNDVPSVDLWRVFRQGYQELRGDLEKLSREAAEIRVRRQKMEEAAAMLEAATGKKLDLPELTDASGEKYKAGRRKQEFGPVGSEEAAATNSPLNAFRRSNPSGAGAASPALGGGVKSLKSLGSMKSMRK